MSAMGYCFVASNERGTFAACADEPEDRVWEKHTKMLIAEWVRQGHKVERVTTEEARARLKAYKRERPEIGVKS